eukprot:TRINITY_DN21795_c0_g1_i1.p1 TRINITY_DN21795_c0_g1~~TRINITY_DN21795_c0_g1_i1.p1  ORF type:complete len:1211 (+),score=252.97 TRINITY_DN21795_c0_g1_i1:142-3774(+)
MTVETHGLMLDVGLPGSLAAVQPRSPHSPPSTLRTSSPLASPRSNLSAIVATDRSPRSDCSVGSGGSSGNRTGSIRELGFSSASLGSGCAAEASEDAGCQGDDTQRLDDRACSGDVVCGPSDEAGSLSAEDTASGSSSSGGEQRPAQQPSPASRGGAREESSRERVRVNACFTSAAQTLQHHTLMCLKMLGHLYTCQRDKLLVKETGDLAIRDGEGSSAHVRFGGIDVPGLCWHTSGSEAARTNGVLTASAMLDASLRAVVAETRSIQTGCIDESPETARCQQDEYISFDGTLTTVYEDEDFESKQSRVELPREEPIPDMSFRTLCKDYKRLLERQEEAQQSPEDAISRLEDRRASLEENVRQAEAEAEAAFEEVVELPQLGGLQAYKKRSGGNAGLLRLPGSQLEKLANHLAEADKDTLAAQKSVMELEDEAHKAMLQSRRVQGEFAELRLLLRMTSQLQEGEDDPAGLHEAISDLVQRRADSQHKVEELRQRAAIRAAAREAEERSICVEAAELSVDKDSALPLNAESPLTNMENSSCEMSTTPSVPTIDPPETAEAKVEELTSQLVHVQQKYRNLVTENSRLRQELAAGRSGRGRASQSSRCEQLSASASTGALGQRVSGNRPQSRRKQRVDEQAEPEEFVAIAAHEHSPERCSVASEGHTPGSDFIKERRFAMGSAVRAMPPPLDADRLLGSVTSAQGAGTGRGFDASNSQPPGFNGGMPAAKLLRRRVLGLTSSGAVTPNPPGGAQPSAASQSAAKLAGGGAPAGPSAGSANSRPGQQQQHGLSAQKLSLAALRYGKDAGGGDNSALVELMSVFRRGSNGTAVGADASHHVNLDGLVTSGIPAGTPTHGGSVGSCEQMMKDDAPTPSSSSTVPLNALPAQVVSVPPSWTEQSPASWSTPVSAVTSSGQPSTARTRQRVQFLAAPPFPPPAIPPPEFPSRHGVGASSSTPQLLSASATSLPAAASMQPAATGMPPMLPAAAGGHHSQHTSQSQGSQAMAVSPSGGAVVASFVRGQASARSISVRSVGSARSASPIGAFMAGSRSASPSLSPSRMRRTASPHEQQGQPMRAFASSVHPAASKAAPHVAAAAQQQQMSPASPGAGRHSLSPGRRLLASSARLATASPAGARSPSPAQPVYSHLRMPPTVAWPPGGGARASWPAPATAMGMPQPLQAQGVFGSAVAMGASPSHSGAVQVAEPVAQPGNA